MAQWSRHPLVLRKIPGSIPGTCFTSFSINNFLDLNISETFTILKDFKAFFYILESILVFSICTTYNTSLMLCKMVYNQLFGRASSKVSPG